MSIQRVLKKIKTDFDTAITTAQFNGKSYANGSKAKTALICSQRIINYIHEFIKNEFIRCGVPNRMIYPPPRRTSPEIKIKGFLKSKNQDVAIIPSPDIVSGTRSINSKNEKILTVNIRSQLSSLSKNIDTLYERTFAEPLNLHLSYPKQCLGEVYLIPTHEYDDKAMVKNKIVFNKAASKMVDYISMFQAINNRRTIDKDEFKYERVCLLIADFRQANPKLYNSVDDLMEDNMIPENGNVNMDGLAIDNFAQDLVNVYIERFGQGIIV